MARDQKRRKKSTKKAAKRKSQAVGRLHGASAQAPANVRLIGYEVTSEPLLDPAYHRLPDSVKDQLDKLHRGLIAPGSRDRLAVLLTLIEQYPDIPQIHNYLYTTYQELKDWSSARRVLEETLERFPDYLFGRISYAMDCLDEGETEKVPEIFENQFALHLLYPERRRFHISEVLGFHATMARYFCARKEFEIAERYYELMHQIGPGDPRTQFIKELLAPSRLRALYKELLARKS